MKSTACPAFGRVNVTVTGLVVPNVNDGIVTLALLAFTRVSPCNPMPAFTKSTVTEPEPGVIASKAAALPGKTSVTVRVGVHVPGPGVGVGVGGTGVGVGVGGTGVGVGVGGTGVGVGGTGVGVGAGPPAHCARIKIAFTRDEARNVKSTG